MRLYEFITTNMELILQGWEKFAREIWPGDLPNTDVLRDHAKEMLLAVAADMQTSQSSRQQEEKSTGHGATSVESGSINSSSVSHAVGRVDSGFDLRSLVAEYRALRASILHLWSKYPEADPVYHIEDMTRFNEALDQLLAESVVSYSQRLDHSREIFLGILGHDLRSPLNAVSMLAGMLEQHGELGGLALKMASQIAVSVRAMETMVSDLLDFTGTRLGASITVTRQPMDLSQLAQEVLAEIGAAHPSRAFHLITKGTTGGEWDPARLRQMISNLLGNAIQHGFATTPITLALDGENDDVLLSVRNQGNPIPRDALSFIFEPLRRNSNDQITKPTGSIGLGLYIAKEVATTHGGIINVTSDTEETVFIVRLPRASH